MVESYIQSIEEYKGWTLKIRKYILDSNTRIYHRDCDVTKGDKGFIFKTKKEAKEFIDCGVLDTYGKD